MKKNIIIILLLCPLFLNSQTDNGQKVLHVIDALFPNYETSASGSQKLVFTKVWDHHATINLAYAHTAELEDGICAVTFTIWLSENPNDYKIMNEEEYISMDMVEEGSEFTGGIERLIQVVFYDFDNDKFIGKPEGFPVSGLPWLAEEMTIPLEYTWTESLNSSPACKNICILTIQEYSDMYPVKLYYIFKYQNNKILNSGPVRGSLVRIYEKENTIFGVFEEYDDTGEVEEYEAPIMNF